MRRLLLSGRTNLKAFSALNNHDVTYAGWRARHIEEDRVVDEAAVAPLAHWLSWPARFRAWGKAYYDRSGGKTASEIQTVKINLSGK